MTRRRKRLPPNVIRERLGFAAMDDPPPAETCCGACRKPRILPGPDGRCAVCRATGKPLAGESPS